jgi:hypothetical protein
MVKLTSVASKRLKLLAPLLAAPAALLLNPGRAEAVLTYNIFQSGADVVVQATGSLNLAGATFLGPDSFGAAGFLVSSSATIATGPDVLLNFYQVSGPFAIPGTANFGFSSPASSVIGPNTAGLIGNFNGDSTIGGFGINTSYVSGSSILSSATFNGQTLAGLGLTTPGLLGTWSLVGGSDSIRVILGAPAPVPGPLPLLGAAAAFGWSRRLRRRISVSNTTTVG